MSEISGRSHWPKHFDGNRFYNPGAPEPHGFKDVLRWKLTSRAEASPDFVADVQPSKPPARINGDKLLVTFINHATVLLQTRGVNILTDPIWSQRASPFSFIGPKRHREPGVRKEDLPEIDLVLLSHNHYDHLDLPTLNWLRDRSRNTVFVVPLRVAEPLRTHGIETVHELDWGEARMVGNTTIYCVPAVHFSARNAFDRNRTLWCGYVIESSGGPVYFAGDTAFGDHFAQIRHRFGVPRLSFLPIGAYQPRWFMSPVHMSPEEALKAHEILASRATIGIHHGTFQLADDGIDTPAQQILRSPHPEQFLILRNGESVTIE